MCKQGGMCSFAGLISQPGADSKSGSGAWGQAECTPAVTPSVKGGQGPAVAAAPILYPKALSQGQR